MDINQELLENLGKAIYMHKALIKKAEKAEKAVEYLVTEGVLPNNEVK